MGKEERWGNSLTLLSKSYRKKFAFPIFRGIFRISLKPQWRKNGGGGAT
jgi:hypothetical protein